MLYDKLLEKESIKTVGIWTLESWNQHNLKPMLEGVGEFHYLFVPEKKSLTFDNQIYNLVKEVKPDLVFSVLDNAQVSAVPFLRLNRLNIPTVNYFSSKNFAAIKYLSNAFTLNVTSNAQLVPLYSKSGCELKTVYIPYAADPDMCSYKNLIRCIDISFVGTRTENRAKVIAALETKGYKVEVYGKGWPNGEISFEEMINIYNESYIVLGMSKIATKRDFEAPMCGSLYLREQYSDSCFVPDRELVFWKNISELIKKIDYYLANYGNGRTISCLAHFKARTEHTWMDRLAVVFKYLRSLGY